MTQDQTHEVTQRGLWSVVHRQDIIFMWYLLLSMFCGVKVNIGIYSDVVITNCDLQYQWKHFMVT